MNTNHDEMFKAMADPSRRQILSALCRQPHEAGELARLVGLAPNALSFHLRALKSASLVHVRRDGRYLRYSLDDRGLTTWRKHVDQLFIHGRVPGYAPVEMTPPPPPTSTIPGSEPEAEPLVEPQLPTELL